MVDAAAPHARERAGGGPPYRAAWVACCAALLGIGAYTALLGPALPDLAERAGIGIGNAGVVFTALFAAAIVSTVVAGRSLDRFGHRRPLVIGLAINGLGLLLLPWVVSWPMLLGLAALLGLGDGAVIVGAHVLVAQISPEREAAALNRLNVFFGVGAVLGPALAALVRAGGGRAAIVLAAAGALQLAYAAVVTVCRLPAAAAAARTVTAPVSVTSSRLLWLLAVLLLVYVGVEVGLGGWAFTYARQSAGLGGTAAALLSSGFWCALTLGRLLSPLPLRRWTPATLLLAAPLVAAAGALALVARGEVPVVLVAGVLVAGLGFGPVWPVTFAIAARAFPGAAGRASGLLGMVSAVGGLALPWLQGRVLDAGGPTAGISVTFAGCLLVAALALAARRAAAPSPCPTGSGGG